MEELKRLERKYRRTLLWMAFALVAFPLLGAVLPFLDAPTDKLHDHVVWGLYGVAFAGIYCAFEGISLWQTASDMKKLRASP